MRALLSIAVIAISFFISCNRIDKTYHSVISDNETRDTRVLCYTALGIPFACLVSEETIKTVRLVEIVTEIVEITVIETKTVEVEKITKEIETVYVERQPDINEIVEKVIEVIKQDYPNLDLSDTKLAEITSDVTETVINETPGIVVRGGSGGGGSGGGGGLTPETIPPEDIIAMEEIPTTTQTGGGGGGGAPTGGGTPPATDDPEQEPEDEPETEPEQEPEPTEPKTEPETEPEDEQPCVEVERKHYHFVYPFNEGEQPVKREDLLIHKHVYCDLESHFHNH